MAGDDDDSDKTEDPSAKRLEEAHRKGQVAMSREVNNWIVLLAGTMVITMMAGSFMSSLVDTLRIFIEQPEKMPQAPGGLSTILGQTFWRVVGLLAFPLLALSLAAIVGPFAQVGPLFAPDTIQFDLAKISPMQGFTRIFSRRAFAEFLKSLFKFLLIGTVCYIALSPYFADVEHFVGLPMQDLLNELMHLFVRLMTGVLCVLAVLAGVDYVYQRNEFMKKMRMTKQEQKEEYKQSEGDPKIKARLRQLRFEKARKRMMQNVPKADVVITNPTHYAIALQYDPETMDAPICLAKGTDEVALRIREIAKEHKIVIQENPPLARALYSTVEIDEIVPPEHYKAVAEVISFVFKLKGKIK